MEAATGVTLSQLTRGLKNGGLGPFDQKDNTNAQGLKSPRSAGADYSTDTTDAILTGICSLLSEHIDACDDFMTEQSSTISTRKDPLGKVYTQIANALEIPSVLKGNSEVINITVSDHVTKELLLTTIGHNAVELTLDGKSETVNKTKQEVKALLAPYKTVVDDTQHQGS